MDHCGLDNVMKSWVCVRIGYFSYYYFINGLRFYLIFQPQEYVNVRESTFLSFHR